MQQTAQMMAQLRSELGIEVGFSEVMLAFSLLLARVLPPIILTPFLGGESVPPEVKMGLGVMLGMVLFPAMAAQVKEIPIEPVLYIALMLKELFIGLTLTMVIGMIFDAAQAAGSLVDTMSGTNQAQLMVPMIGVNASLFSNLQLQLSTTLFLTLGGHHLVIQAFGDSLAQIPLNAFPSFHGGAATWTFYNTVIRVFGDMVRISLALASPVLLATFLTDLALGMVNRVAPQVQVFFISMQIKPGVTIVIMFFAMHLIMDRVTLEFGTMFRWLHQVMTLLR